MANVKAKLKSKLTGDIYFVETLGELVKNTDGTNTWDLGGVQANAQVNTIETVKVNGTALTPDANKAVDITIAAQSEYTVAKLATAESGYLASYALKKDGTQVGDTINIPKDYLVKSASMGICEEAGVPSTTPALAVGDPYLDFVINTKDGSATDEHIYINVKGLVDIYTAGNGIDIVNNVVSVDTTDTSIADAAPTASSTKFVQSGGVYTALAGKVDNLSAAATAGTYTKVTIQANGLVSGGSSLQASDIPSLSLSKISDVTASASEVNVLDGITASTDELNILDGVTATTAELNYVDGVTSNIQDQLNAKQATITGAASSIVSSDLTASKAVVSDANGKVAASSVTATELGLLSGMTDMLVIEAITES